MKKILFILLLPLLLLSKSFAAVGCDLNEPDRDVKRFLPASTGYRTQYFSVDKLGGGKLLAEIETALGDKFHGLYETIDVPYTFYKVFKDKETIGYIHGVNQKGVYGGIQVFLVFDVGGNIKDLYIQKLTSKKAKEFRSKEFTKQFAGFNLKDFEDYDVITAKSKNGSKVSSIKNITDDEKDFSAIMRGVKKNLILSDIFVKAAKGDK